MISIIIPVFNEENAIGKCIDEIEKVLNKNKKYKDYEIIIVNDGSTDNTYNEIKKRNVKIINNPCNMGYGYSLKKGINKALYETIVIIDGDYTYPFSYFNELIKEKEKGFDLVVGARTGKYYKESFSKVILRSILRRFVEMVSGKKIVDINSGFRIFDKSTVIPFFPRLCNTFSFTTSQTLAYVMNSLTVKYIEIPYNKRIGKSKIKLFKDSLILIKYILESCIYYNPLKIFSLFSIICIFLSLIGFIFSHFMNIHAGYILGIGGLLVSILIMSIGFLAVLLKQIMDKNK